MNIALSTYEKKKSFNTDDVMTSFAANVQECKIRTKIEEKSSSKKYRESKKYLSKEDSMYAPTEDRHRIQ